MPKKYRIAVVTPHPGEDWHSQSLIEAANRVAKGIAVNPIDFSASLSPEVSVTIRNRNALSHDAFLLRGLNKEGDVDFQFEIYGLIEEIGCLVINRIAPVLTALDKFQTTLVLARAGLPTPMTQVTQRLAEAVRFVEQHGKAVVKPLYGSLGEDVILVDANDSPGGPLSQLLNKYGVLYVQEFIEHPGRDIRAFVVGDEVAAAIYRVVGPGHWKTNIHQGATPYPLKLAPELEELSVRAAKAVGLDYTGVDIIESDKGPMILEVNGTPFWAGVNTATGDNMADRIIRYTLSRLEERGRR